MSEDQTIRFLDELRDDLREVARFDASRSVGAGRSRLQFLNRRWVLVTAIVLATLAAVILTQDSLRARVFELFDLSTRGTQWGPSLDYVRADRTGGIWLAGTAAVDGRESGESTVGVVRLVGDSWQGLPVVEGMNVVTYCPLTEDDVWLVTDTAFTADWYQEQNFMHWDGRNWTEIPHPESPAEEFYDMVAVSPDDIWLVGRCAARLSGAPSSLRGDLLHHMSPLTLHWDGERWRKVPTPAMGIEDEKWWAGGLSAVAAGQDGEVWAVGGYEWKVGNLGDGPIAITDGEPLVLRWNGRRWVRVPMPVRGYAMGAGDVTLLNGRRPWVLAGVQALTQLGGNEPAYSVVLRWNGRSWQDVGGDTVPMYTGLRPAHVPHPELFIQAWQIDGTSPSDVWLAGYEGSTIGAGTLHWDGHKWVPEAATHELSDRGGERDVPYETVARTGPGIAVVAEDDAYLISGSTVFSPALEGDSGIHLLWRWDGEQWNQLHLVAPDDSE